MAARSYDIITVGGGIAASTLAKAMAGRGAKVLLLEREKQFKDRVRGEAVVPWGVAEANELGLCSLLKEKCAHEVPHVEAGWFGATRPQNDAGSIQKRASRSSAERTALRGATFPPRRLLARTHFGNWSSILSQRNKRQL